MSAKTPRRLVAISAGTSQPSTTRLLADRVAQKTIELLAQAGTPATAATIELGPLAVEIAQATVSGFPADALRQAIAQLAAADGVIAATPVYKAGISGLFKSFIDVLDDDLLIAKPVTLAATAGTSRHALVLDDQLRPLFAYMRALTLPTSVFAGPEDWSAAELSTRIERGATELATMIGADVGGEISARTWESHRHTFGGSATRSANVSADIDFDTDLMRLATGGSAPPDA